MFGLCMIKDYLDEILDGKKTNDVRSYDTNKRGTIALVDSRSAKVYGYVDLVGTHKITPQGYASWHCTGKWSGCTMQVDESKDYYSYDFVNPRRVEIPYKVNKDKKVWIWIDD